MSISPVFIGISGGSASGKTSLVRKIREELGVNCTVLEMDSFYKPLTPEQLANAEDYNFDHPDSIDMDEILRATSELLKNQDTMIPIYDFTTHSRRSNKQFVQPSRLIIFEGIYALYDNRLTDNMILKIFVQTDDDIRLCRRIKRDIQERGRELDGVLNQYFRFVKPAYDEFVLPTMKKADIIVPNGASNLGNYQTVAIEMIVQFLNKFL